MTAADRLSARDMLDAATLCDQAESALTALVEIMNQETTLLRAGKLREAAELTGEKTQRAQDYTTLARVIQRAAPRLKQEAPERLDVLRRGHERLATQMADNLRVLATAKTVTQTLIEDVAASAGRTSQAKTYGAGGGTAPRPADPMKGLSINKAL